MRAFKILTLSLLLSLNLWGQARQGGGARGNATAGIDWNKPFPAHKIIGNVYFVGSELLGSFLITTPAGHILINSDYEETVPVIRAAVEKLGFKFTDIKVLLISHAHWDHDAASDTIKKLTGAKYLVMDADVPVVESGGKADFHYGNDPSGQYRPTKVDRVLHDGDVNGQYATKEAAFEAAVAAASLAMRQGHEVHVSVPAREGDAVNRAAS